MRIVLATSNAGKLREFRALLEPLAIEVQPLSDFTTQSVDETGLSFVENAILKARFAARAAGLPALADDSGLEVDALRGAPGIHSARYAGPGATDQANNEKLLEAMRGIERARRQARYRCVLAFMRWDTDPFPLICQASWEGIIVETPRGCGGFGYDPLFELPGRGLTAAELPPEEKNRLSHRGRALQELVQRLEQEMKPLGALT
ncbi:MAG: RdgB/HAM1 family non-canonical purine NTP pyrophosphatase [Gammaproteobacteria bacterium]|nr:non-canonical purine NTP pyrophosphatase, RdgB/HAM1 family [Gammaproteobacteria bacterium]